MLSHKVKGFLPEVKKNPEEVITRKRAVNQPVK